MNKIFLTVIYIFCNNFLICAQTGDQNQTNISNIIPPSPEASQLGKYVEIPVGYYTGVPETSIPIYQVKQGGLSVPISLSYHSGGIKTEEFASWVGIGWTLNAGGAVTRVIRGLPDDKSDQQSFQNLSSQYSYEYLIGGATQGFDPRGTILRDIFQSCADAEPDLFMFNFNGYTGKMMYDWNGQLVVSCTKPIKVLDIRGTDIYPNRIIGWDITTEDGTIYKFRDTEKSYTRFNAGPTCHGNIRATSTWFLTDIFDVNNENWVHFQYDSYTQTINHRSSASIKHERTNQSGTLQSTTSVNTYDGKRLSRITTSSGICAVDFISGAIRSDLADLYNPSSTVDNNNLRSLSRIVVKDNLLSEKGGFNFSYDYSTGRLTLKTITESFNGNSKPSHELFYEPGQLPSITSTSQDHWGYANGNTHPDLIPGYWADNGSSGTYYVGADRSPNFSTTKIGSLTSIKYPTGGKVLFEYEQNEYSLIQSTPIESFCRFNKIQAYAQTQSGSNYDANATGIKSTTFTVNSTPCADIGFDQRILVQFSFEAFNYDAATLAQKPWVRILSPQGTEIFFQRFGPNEGNNTSPTVGGFYKKLSPGTYTLEAFGTLNTSNPGELPPNYASIYSNFQNPTTLKTKEYTGGLRIRKIVEKASEGDLYPRVRKFYYNPDGDNIHSSGVIYQEPRYEYSGFDWDYYDPAHPPGFCGQGSQPFEYVLRLSQNVTSLGTTQGSHIGYREVSVVYGENIVSGKSTLKYTSPVEYGDDIPQMLPFAPATSSSYATGLLKEQNDYLYTGTITRIVKNTTNEYFTKVRSIPGLKLASNTKLDCAIGSCCMEHFLYGTYATILGHTQLKKSTETIYDSDGLNTTLITQNEFLYDAELQNLKKRTFTNSKGIKQVNEMYYPKEYLIPTTVINDMKVKNMVGLPLETIAKKVDGSNNEWILSGKFNQYGNINGKIRLTSNHTIKTASAVPVASFNYSISNSNMDTRYAKDFDFVYESGAGNMVEFTKLNDLPTSILWGHANTLPIAKVIGSNYSTVSSAYNAVGGNLSALRSHSSLANAFVSTYSYKPLTGMTSETDPNGKIVWYEYDALNRLSLVRDHDNNVLKKICYNYVGQVETCCTDFTADWQNTTTPVRCQLNASGQNTGYYEQEQRDQNPCSAPYNNPRWVATVYNSTACPLPAGTPCSFAISSGYSTPTNSINSNGTTASGYFVFYPSGTMQPGITYNVATINGSCRPSATRTILHTSGGRNWTVIIYPSGQMSWIMGSGGATVNPGTTVALNSFTYNL